MADGTSSTPREEAGEHSVSASETAKERGAPRKEEAENLEKLTDHVDEQQISLNQYNVEALKQALAEFAKQEQELEAQRRKREKELNAIKINDSDLKVIQEQFDYSRKEAERVLREAGGELKTCLKTLMEA